MYKSLAVQLQSTAESGHGRRRQHLGLSALATCGMDWVDSFCWVRAWLKPTRMPLIKEYLSSLYIVPWLSNPIRYYVSLCQIIFLFFFWHGEPLNSLVKPTIPQIIITSSQSQLSEPRLILTDCPKCCDGCSKSTRWCALWQAKLFSNILDNISRLNVTLNWVPHSLAFYAARAMSHASFCF